MRAGVYSSRDPDQILLCASLQLRKNVYGQARTIHKRGLVVTSQENRIPPKNSCMFSLILLIAKKREGPVHIQLERKYTFLLHSLRPQADQNKAYFD